MKNGFLDIQKGIEVQYKSEVHRIAHLISPTEVLLARKQDGMKCVAKLLELEPIADEIDLAIKRDLTQFTDKEWETAEARLKLIWPLLNANRSFADVQEVANKANVHSSTIYQWIRRYEEGGELSALVPARRGPQEGAKRVNGDVEAIITSTIEEKYLHKQKRNASYIVREILEKCKAAGLTAPHSNTIRHRLHSINPRLALSRRGRKDRARDMYAPVLDSFPGASYPLAVVQIDHTPCDVIVVDETHRKPIGRPWLTLAIDVFSRMVVGYYISLETPNANAVGICLSTAILPKQDRLIELGITADWPVWGVMKAVHCDNAREFRGKMLGRACASYNMDLHLRPVRVPHYGGHIERMMGTVAAEMKLLPGATFSNPAQRKGYDSNKNAAMTMFELERYLVEYIVNVYHQRFHKGIHMSPLRKWHLGIVGDDRTVGSGVPQIPLEHEKLRIDFLPFYETTVQRYGIQIDNLQYYEPCLDQFINAVETSSGRKKKFVVRRDPRDISHVHFLDPGTQSYLRIPSRELGLPSVSLDEYLEARKLLLQEGKQDIDEALIARTVESLRARVDEASAKTKSARRKKEVRQSNSKRLEKMNPAPLSRPRPSPYATHPASFSTEKQIAVPVMPPGGDGGQKVVDLFDQEIEPFSLGSAHAK